MLNYSDRTIVFPSIPSSESIIPINLYLSSLSIDYCGKEGQGYVLLSTNVLESKQKLNEILIVREYPNMFLEDILEFPPEREIEFSIDLVLGIGPISIASYQQ